MLCLVPCKKYPKPRKKGVVDGYQAIEKGVVGTYKKIETAAVNFGNSLIEEYDKQHKREDK